MVSIDLLTANEAEIEFGQKYFYRMRIYRLADKGIIPIYTFKGQTCYQGSDILKAFLRNLETKLVTLLPTRYNTFPKVFFDNSQRRIVVDGLFGKAVFVNTETETEEDLLEKVKLILQEQRHIGYEISDGADLLNDAPRLSYGEEITQQLPEDISWIKIDTGLVEGVEVKSYILVSLPSIAEFLGIRPDAFITWVAHTTFKNVILSAHHKQIQETQISVPWKKGITAGHTAFIPFELLPELVVAFRQSGRTITYPEKAEMLYQLAKSTLEAVGLAISGNADKAATELARIGRGLGLTAADQIIAIFKQYESRDFQIHTNKEFNSKVKEMGGDYRITTGKLTIGITGHNATYWKRLGKTKKLPKKALASGREVMRQISPGDGVGMTFGERHYIKDPLIDEAIETGKQGKDFYNRLKKVGLLED